MTDIYAPETVARQLRHLDRQNRAAADSLLRRQLKDALLRCTYNIHGLTDCDPTCACRTLCGKVQHG